MNLINYLGLPREEKINIFLQELSITNRTTEYYINWEKVVTNTRKFELELNTLNFLIGKENIYFEAIKLFEQQPQLLKAIPSLLACREYRLNILILDDFDNMQFNQLDFETIDVTRIVEYVDFMQNTGLLTFLQNCVNRSLVDYVYGVEVGLDSNARKNRSGTIMEQLVEKYVSKTCQRQNLVYLTQATPKQIKRLWNIDVPADKSQRRFDVAIYSSKKNHLWLIEANYYGGGGSKLKSVSGEFIELSQFVSQKENISFIWVTDGQGWKQSHLPLQEAFGYIDNIFNLYMLSNNYLDELVNIS